MNMRIGIIGYGNMGQAIAQRLKEKYRIFVFEKDALKTKNCPGLIIVDSLEEMVNSVGVMIIAVKPQDFEAVLFELKKFSPGQLLVSIAAGISTQYIESIIGEVRVIRAMPNLPIKVGEAMTCICKGVYANAIDVSFVQGLFNRLGKTLLIEERFMNAVTAISGSGPGFLFSILETKDRSQWKENEQAFTERLKKAAVKAGFSEEEADLLASQTTKGSFALLEETKTPAHILRVQVTSKAGTTEAGLNVLQGRVENLDQAVKAALKRAEELSKK